MHPFVFTVLVIVAAVKAGKLMELIIFFIIVSQLITFFSNGGWFISDQQCYMCLRGGTATQRN